MKTTLDLAYANYECLTPRCSVREKWTAYGQYTWWFKVPFGYGDALMRIVIWGNDKGTCEGHMNGWSASINGTSIWKPPRKYKTAKLAARAVERRLEAIGNAFSEISLIVPG